MNGYWAVLNLLAVRLALQGPLAQFFPGVAYDATTDKFTPTTTAGLTPTYTAIFAGAPADAAGASAWLQEWAPILQVFLGGFARPGNFDLSYGYEFANMVPAYEATSLPLGIPANLIVSGGFSFRLADLRMAA